MKDFTKQIYKELLTFLHSQFYSFQTFENYLKEPKEKVVLLRHDVDKLPANSFTTAKIEHGLGIKGTYYFRIVPESYDEKIIKQIADLGHEIGYHYENLSEISKKKVFYSISPKGEHIFNMYETLRR